MNKDRYLELCQEVHYHNKCYWVDNAPKISDEAFDQLLVQIQEIERDHPDWTDPSSPTQRLGEVLTEGFQVVQHPSPMLSLDKTFSKEELVQFIERVERLTEREEHQFCSELKMDGTAVRVTYRDGVFHQAVTRGDGRQGDDVTAQLKTIQSLPLRLIGSDLPEELDVRGEVFMPRSVFEALNEERDELGLSAFANPRNAAAGALKLLDPHEVRRRQLSVVFYQIGNRIEGLTEQYASHEKMKQWGLPVLQEVALTPSIEAIWAFVQKIGGLRGQLGFDIDGVVVKLNEMAHQRELGATNKHPRWAAVYKFPAEQATTCVNAITIQVGRTGVLTPVAELEPVRLAGSVISRATLHNAQELERKGIRVGDTVIIEKGGDVIPKITEVVLDKRPSDSTSWAMPPTCPACGASVIHVEGEVAIRCPNVACKEKNLRRFIHFTSKQAMDIDHLGERVVGQLLEAGFVTKLADFFTITEEQLGQLEGFKEKSIQNLLKSLERAKEVPFERFIMALGIPYVGQGAATALAEEAKTLERLRKMSFEELCGIDGIGEKTAEAVVEFFQLGHEVDELLAVGVKLKAKTLIEGHLFAGKVFVITGTLTQYTRDEAKALLKERGAKVGSSVGKKTDYLLVGESPGSKLSKAENLGVEIMTEADFHRELR